MVTCVFVCACVCVCARARVSVCIHQVPQKVVLKEQFWAFLQTVTVDAADKSESLGYVQSSPFAWDSEQVIYTCAYTYIDTCI